jgi:tetratricopeptide (TPR) repeat protein
VTDSPTQAPTAPASVDAKQQFEEKVAEAEGLLAQGNMEGALGRLREANALDPSNTRAHRRLGELLLSTGVRREAIDEFRAVTRNAPEDFTAWRQLATAQFAEGLYRDAAESYRRVVSLAGEQTADPSDLLSYADALRLSGRADEARAVYERLTTAAASDVASLARQRLTELAQAQPVPAPSVRAGEQTGEHTSSAPHEGETASATSPLTQTQPAPPAPTPAPAQPTPTPQASRPAQASPAEHYGRGAQLWSSNRAAALEEFRAAASGGNTDAHYYLGLSYVEGKNLHALNRAEVVAALQHFQLAQRGQFAEQSRRYAQQLGKEFDRLRKQ